MATSQTKPTNVKADTKPASQETTKSTTNDTTTSSNSANAEIQPPSTISVDIRKESNTIIENNNEQVKDTTSEPELKEVLQELSKSAQTETPLQNEKKLQEALKVQLPSAGRRVHFFFDKNDGICTNNMTDLLPATVVMSNGLTTNLVVFTLDSRDCVVLRKEIPHISEAKVDTEGTKIRPYWDWPIIVR